MKIQAFLVLNIAAWLSISGTALAEAFNEPSGFIPVTLPVFYSLTSLKQVPPPQANKADGDGAATCSGFCYLPPPGASTPMDDFNDDGQS